MSCSFAHKLSAAVHADAAKSALPAEPLIAQPLVELDGKQYLPSTATSAQVIALMNKRRDGMKKKRKDKTQMAGLKVSFHRLYNVVQAHGGYLKVMPA